MVEALTRKIRREPYAGFGEASLKQMRTDAGSL